MGCINGKHLAKKEPNTNAKENAEDVVKPSAQTAAEQPASKDVTTQDTSAKPNELESAKPNNESAKPVEQTETKKQEPAAVIAEEKKAEKPFEEKPVQTSTKSEATTDEEKQAPQDNINSADGWANFDGQLLEDQQFKALHQNWSKPCSEELLSKTVSALKEQGHIVMVCEDKEEAKTYLSSLVKDNASVSMATSLTLEQIGFIDYLKTQDSRITNYKGQAARAMMEGNIGEQQALLAKGATSDIFFSSVGAVGSDGFIIAGDLTGTRLNGWYAAGRLVLVLGSNKIVENEVEATKRLKEYQLKLESARVRVAYKVKESAILNTAVITRANPMGPRTTIVIVKEALGF